MSKWGVRAALVLIIGMLLAASWHLDASRQTQAQKEDPAVLLDRPWVDHFPSSEQEPFRMIRFGSDSIGLYGLFDSRYKVTIELFEFENDSKEVHFDFPHDNTKAVSPYAIDRVKEGQFDLRLTLKKDPRGRTEQQVYFSRTDWRESKNWPAFLQKALQH